GRGAKARLRRGAWRGDAHHRRVRVRGCGQGAGDAAAPAARRRAGIIGGFVGAAETASFSRLLFFAVAFVGATEVAMLSLQGLSRLPSLLSRAHQELAAEAAPTSMPAIRTGAR